MDDSFDICIESPLTCNEDIFICWLYGYSIQHTCDSIINGNNYNNVCGNGHGNGYGNGSTNGNNDNTHTNINNNDASTTSTHPQLLFRQKININNNIYNNTNTDTITTTTNNITNPNNIPNSPNTNQLTSTPSSTPLTLTPLTLTRSINRHLLLLEITDHYKCYNIFAYYLQQPSLLIQITIGIWVY